MININIKKFITKGYKFAIIGGIGTLINLFLLYSLVSFFGIFYLLSELIAIIIVFLFNYVGNILIGNIDVK